MSAAQQPTRVVEDIAPFGIDGRDVVAHYERRLSPGPTRTVDGHALWPATSREVDVHAGFHGRFTLPGPAQVTIELLGVNAYRAWLDGARLWDGPGRFPVAAPTCETGTVALGPGEHVLAVHVHGYGVRTRMLADLPPFLWCRVHTGDDVVDLEWRASQLRGLPPTGVRTSPLLGWVEWHDTRADGEWWRDPQPPLGWDAPGTRRPGVGAVAGERPPVPVRALPMKALASGQFRERRASIFFPGHELDDPVAQLMTTDLAPAEGDEPDGAWWRFDLGRVRSGTVRLTIDGPAGTGVTIAMSERLFDGRVIPVLTPGRTCVVSHFVLRGGRQEIEPLSVQGGRFVELRVTDPTGAASLVDATFAERDGLGEPLARFACGDELLERIWSTGLETVRAAASDAMIDSIRERAQWTGDTLTVGLEIGAVGWNDLGLFRQALFHAADCADADGLVAGCCPGDIIYLSTFACYWMSAALRYVELTGDAEILHELVPAARANLAALRGHIGDDGNLAGAPWPFVDWGHTPTADGADPALVAIVLTAARDLVRWEQLIGEPASDAQAFAAELEELLRDLVADDAGIGFHATVLALRCGILSGAAHDAAVANVKAHLLSCFPNDRSAPRLRDATVRDPRVITPFFGHFSLAALLDAGEVDFVAAQWRACWGWMLDRGAQTWLEVFDEGWSHCHFWSGCPTWQMSRHLLGLWPRGDRGAGHADLRLNAGSLEAASGVVAVFGGEAEIAWTREPAAIRWRIHASRPLTIDHAGRRHEVAAGVALQLEIDTR